MTTSTWGRRTARSDAWGSAGDPKQMREILRAWAAGAPGRQFQLVDED